MNFSDRRFSVDDEQMMFFTNLVKDTLEAIQGPIAIMNILPWLESVLPTYIQNKLFDVDRLLGERNKLSKYLKVSINVKVKYLRRTQNKRNMNC